MLSVTVAGKKLTAVIIILFFTNLFLWPNASASSGSGSGGGEYSISDVESGEYSAVDSTFNTSMVLMLAAAAVAVYGELTCGKVTSVHIYAATAAAFLAYYLYEISDLEDDIEDIITRYEDFNFSTSTNLDSANRDLQIEAFQLCQEENTQVATHLRSIATTHYLAAAGFAAAAAWALLMEAPKPAIPGCEMGLLCDGKNAQCKVAVSDGGKYSHYAYWEVARFFSVLLPTSWAAPSTGAPDEILKGKKGIFEIYWQRALIFAGFAAFAYYVGSLYEDHATTYDARAAACAELEQELNETSSEDPGITISQNLNLIDFFLPLASAEILPGQDLVPRLCYLSDAKKLPVLTSCQSCSNGEKCRRPLLPALTVQKPQLPNIFADGLQDVSAFEKLVYSGRQNEALEVAKKAAIKRHLLQRDLEKMFRQKMPTMLAQGATQLPYEKLIEQYQKQVELMGKEYFEKMNPAEQNDFMRNYRLPHLRFNSNHQRLHLPRTAIAANELDTKRFIEAKGTSSTIIDPMVWQDLLQRAEIHPAAQQSLFHIISSRYQKKFFDEK